jgi:hypothetical protein
VIKLWEVVMILDLHRQGLSVSAIALRLGTDRKTGASTSHAASKRRSMARGSRALGASTRSSLTCVSGSRLGRA